MKARAPCEAAAGFLDVASGGNEANGGRDALDMSEIGINRRGIDSDWAQIESAELRDELAIARDESAGLQDAAAMRMFGPDVTRVVAAVRKLDAAMRQDAPAMRKIAAAVRRNDPDMLRDQLAGLRDLAAVRTDEADI